MIALATVDHGEVCVPRIERFSSVWLRHMQAQEVVVIMADLLTALICLSRRLRPRHDQRGSNSFVFLSLVILAIFPINSHIVATKRISRLVEACKRHN